MARVILYTGKGGDRVPGAEGERRGGEEENQDCGRVKATFTKRLKNGGV